MNSPGFEVIIRPTEYSWTIQAHRQTYCLKVSRPMFQTITLRNHLRRARTLVAGGLIMGTLSIRPLTLLLLINQCIQSLSTMLGRLLKTERGISVRFLDNSLIQRRVIIHLAQSAVQPPTLRTHEPWASRISNLSLEESPILHDRTRSIPVQTSMPTPNLPKSKLWNNNSLSPLSHSWNPKHLPHANLISPQNPLC